LHTLFPLAWLNGTHYWFVFLSLPLA
jgi:hypothetical protein